MYYIQVPGLGFIYKRWQDDEPRFCSDRSNAKVWQTLEGTLEFGNSKLTPRLRSGWEVWQVVDDELIPVIRPQRAH
jgi:hypothetical protein